MPAETRAFLRVALSTVRDPSLPTSIGRLLSDFAACFLADTDAVWRLQMVTHEIAENLVKYAIGPQLTIEVAVDEAPDNLVRCSVISRNTASPAHLGEVRQLLEALVSAAEPVEYYARLMSDNAFKQGSGLGLARIRAEGGFDLEYSIVDHELTLTAVATCSKSGPPQPRHVNPTSTERA